jgi:glycosyltransferase involved in cell wall biosynthesis
MMEDKPVVLTIIPTFNRAALLPEAIESVLSQDYPDKKIIVVDDGSTDETKAICKRYLEKYPNEFSYVFKQNGGCASARNRGLDLINQDTGFVCFLDSDDRFLPGKFSREIELLKRHLDCDYLYSNYCVYDADKKVEKVCQVAAAGHPERFAIEHFLTNEAKSCAMLYRARVFAKRRFNENLKLNEDSEFLQRVAVEFKGSYSEEPDSWIRWHAGSKSRDLLEIQMVVLQSNLDIIKAYPDFYSRFRDQIDQRNAEIKDWLFNEFALRGEWSKASLFSAGFLEKCLVFFRLKVLFRIWRYLSRMCLKNG